MPPAYLLEAWHSGGQASFQPQCSAGGEFCFWCEFRENPSAAEDPCGELKAMARILIEGKKELAVIVSAVKDKYDEEIKSKVKYRNRLSGKTIDAPDWTETSIQKHLVFSSEFPECSELIIHHIHMSILMNLNATMISPEGAVNDDARRQFIETVNSLNRWSKTTKKGPAKC